MKQGLNIDSKSKYEVEITSYEIKVIFKIIYDVSSPNY